MWPHLGNKGTERLFYQVEQLHSFHSLREDLQMNSQIAQPRFTCFVQIFHTFREKRDARFGFRAEDVSKLVFSGGCKVGWRRYGNVILEIYKNKTSRIEVNRIEQLMEKKLETS